MTSCEPKSDHTKKKCKRPVTPPTEKYKERHPKECELYTEVDGPGFGELFGDEDLLAGEVLPDGGEEEDDGDDAVCGEGEDGEEDEAEPPGGHNVLFKRVGGRVRGMGRLTLLRSR